MISISELFISNAYAEGAAAPQGGGFMEFLPLVALLAVFYFLILRPQQKRAKEHKAMMEALQKGDEVVTIGGMLGTVTKVGEDTWRSRSLTTSSSRCKRPQFRPCCPKARSNPSDPSNSPNAVSKVL